MPIAYHCKVCRQPGLAEIEPESDMAAVRRLAPMLTCNPCYDRRERLVKATTLIIKTCWRFFNIQSTAKKKEVIEEARRESRSIIEAATRAYAIVMAEYRGLPNYVWDQSWVDDFMAAPDTVSQILKNYRAALKNWRPE